MSGFHQRSHSTNERSTLLKAKLQEPANALSGVSLPSRKTLIRAPCSHWMQRSISYIGHTFSGVNGPERKSRDDIGCCGAARQRRHSLMPISGNFDTSVANPSSQNHFLRDENMLPKSTLEKPLLADPQGLAGNDEFEELPELAEDRFKPPLSLNSCIC